MGSADAGYVVCDGKRHRIRIDAARVEFLTLGAPDTHLLGKIVLEIRAVHGGQGYWITAPREIRRASYQRGSCVRRPGAIP